MRITYDFEGAPGTALERGIFLDYIGNELDEFLQERGWLFARSSAGGRYLVNVKVTLIPTGEADGAS